MQTVNNITGVVYGIEFVATETISIHSVGFVPGTASAGSLQVWNMAGDWIGEGDGSANGLNWDGYECDTVYGTVDFFSDNIVIPAGQHFIVSVFVVRCVMYGVWCMVCGVCLRIIVLFGELFLLCGWD